MSMKLTKNIITRVEPFEYEQLKFVAENRGMTLSDLVRQSLAREVDPGRLREASLESIRNSYDKLGQILKGIKDG